MKVSERMGSEIYPHVNIGTDKQSAVIRIQATDLSEQYRGVPYGTKKNFTLCPRLVHIFDPATENSLLF